MNIKPLLAALLLPVSIFAQWKDYKLVNNGKDTINRVDQNNRRQGEWVVHYDNLRGEPGYEEEGIFLNGRKEGEWRLYNLMGDLIGIERYHWGLKDGVSQYFSTDGKLRAEQSWKALNPDKPYDTIQVEDVDKLNTYHEVVIKNEGASLRHGVWKFYDTNDGTVVKTESYVLGKLEESLGAATTAQAPAKKVLEKPKEVREFEQRSKRKKIRYQDGTTY